MRYTGIQCCFEELESQRKELYADWNRILVHRSIHTSDISPRRGVLTHGDCFKPLQFTPSFYSNIVLQCLQIYLIRETSETRWMIQTISVFLIRKRETSRDLKSPCVKTPRRGDISLVWMPLIATTGRHLGMVTMFLFPAGIWAWWPCSYSQQALILVCRTTDMLFLHRVYKLNFNHWVYELNVYMILH